MSLYHFPLNFRPSAALPNDLIACVKEHPSYSGRTCCASIDSPMASSPDRRALIHYYALAADVPRVIDMILSKGAGTDVADWNGFTALHNAAARGRVQNIQSLLDGGADVAARDDAGQTALHVAIRHGQSKAAVLLIQESVGSGCVSYINMDGEGGGSGEGSVPSSILCIKDGDGFTPLCLAQAYGMQPIVALLRRALAAATRTHMYMYVRAKPAVGPHTHATHAHAAPPAPPLAPSDPPPSPSPSTGPAPLRKAYYDEERDLCDGAPRLLRAALAGDEAEVRALLGAGRDINAKNLNGRTALHAAAIAGQDAIVTLLLRPQLAEADAEAEGETDASRKRAGGGRTALRGGGGCASAHAHADPYTRTSYIPAHKGADANARDKAGRSPLDLALKERHDSTAAILISVGGAEMAGPTYTKGQSSALHYAASYGLTEVVTALLHAHAQKSTSGGGGGGGGGDGNSASAGGGSGAWGRGWGGNATLLRNINNNNNNNTNGTQRCGNTDSARAAFVDSRDADGWTPLHYAAANGLRKTAEALVRGGANLRARSKTGLTPRDYALREGYGDIAAMLSF